jgi:hypothetical protein
VKALHNGGDKTVSFHKFIVFVYGFHFVVEETEIQYQMLLIQWCCGPESCTEHVNIYKILYPK